MNPITVLITDDDAMLRETWKVMLDADPAFHVLATCASGEEAIEIVERLHPQLVIMDINMPGMSGIEATKIIKDKTPLTKVVGYSLHNEPAYVRKIFSVGAVGYVTKTSSMDEMKTALLSVYRGNQYICGELANKTKLFSATTKELNA